MTYYIIVFKSKHNVNMFAEQNAQVGGTKARIRSKIKNLGVTFDQTLLMHAHVNCQKLFFLLFEKHSCCVLITNCCFILIKHFTIMRHPIFVRL